jgi:hypothetical protein
VLHHCPLRYILFRFNKFAFTCKQASVKNPSGKTKKNVEMLSESFTSRGKCTLSIVRPFSLLFYSLFCLTRPSPFCSPLSFPFISSSIFVNVSASSATIRSLSFQDFHKQTNVENPSGKTKVALAPLKAAGLCYIFISRTYIRQVRAEISREMGTWDKAGERKARMWPATVGPQQRGLLINPLL